VAGQRVGIEDAVDFRERGVAGTDIASQRNESADEFAGEAVPR